MRRIKGELARTQATVFVASVYFRNMSNRSTLLKRRAKHFFGNASINISNPNGVVVFHFVMQRDCMNMVLNSVNENSVCAQVVLGVRILSRKINSLVKIQIS